MTILKQTYDYTIILAVASIWFYDACTFRNFIFCQKYFSFITIRGINCFHIFHFLVLLLLFLLLLLHLHLFNINNLRIPLIVTINSSTERFPPGSHSAMLAPYDAREW